MCGRYTLTRPEEIAEALDDETGPLLGVQNPELAKNLRPRFNIAPTQDAPVVRIGEKGERQLVLLRWGLIPFWAKDMSIGSRMINARGETVAEKASFKAPLKYRRCLVLADGFYEWRKMAGGKQPYHIHLGEGLEKRRPLTLAGLWEHWNKGPEGPLETFTIITTSANDKVAPLHDRMPVILSDDARDTWLDPSIRDPEAVAALLGPYGGDDLDFTPVAKLVNSPSNDRPEVLEPVQVDGYP